MSGSNPTSTIRQPIASESTTSWAEHVWKFPPGSYKVLAADQKGSTASTRRRSKVKGASPIANTVTQTTCLQKQPFTHPSAIKQEPFVKGNGLQPTKTSLIAKWGEWAYLPQTVR